MTRQEILQEARALLILGLPMVGSQVATFSMQITNTVMLGWYSVEALAAMVLSVTIYFSLFVLAAAYAWAVLPMVAAAVANEDETEARRVTRMGFWICGIASLIAQPILWFSEPILLSFGQKPLIAEMASNYLIIMGPSLLPATGVMVLRSFLGALERTQVVLWVTVAAALINAGLNYALIFGNWGFPELGLIGAAWATLAVQSVSFVVLAIYAALLPALRRYELFVRFWRPDWSAFGTVFRLGWPIGISVVSEHGLFAATAVMMGWLGTITLAAHGIALEIIATFFMMHLGLSQAVTVRAGRFFGKADVDGLRRVTAATGIIAFSVLIPTIATCLLAGEWLVGLFLDWSDPDRPAIIAAGASLLVVAAFFQLADAGQVLVQGLLRGVQDTKVPMILASVAYWLVGIPTGYLLGIRLGFGGEGIWVGLIAGLVAAFIGLSLRFRRALRQAAPQALAV